MHKFKRTSQEFLVNPAKHTPAEKRAWAQLSTAEKLVVLADAEYFELEVGDLLTVNFQERPVRCGNAILMIHTNWSWMVPEIRKRRVCAVQHGYRGLLRFYRRLSVKLAELIAKDSKCGGIFNQHSLFGQSTKHPIKCHTDNPEKMRGIRSKKRMERATMRGSKRAFEDEIREFRKGPC